MKNFVIFLILICNAISFSNHLIGEEKTTSQIYPSIDQVHIFQKKLWVSTINNDKLIEVEKLEYVENRLCATVRDENDELTLIYEVASSGTPCPIHQIYHKQCKGCGVLLCPFNCKCFD